MLIKYDVILYFEDFGGARLLTIMVIKSMQ
jgi:hypothetical protein